MLREEIKKVHPLWPFAERPEIGNKNHCEWVRRMERIMNGEELVCCLEWRFCQFVKLDSINKPIHRWVDRDEVADSVVAWIHCPQCGKLHKEMASFDPQLVHYDKLALIENHFKEFQCYNCGLEFATDIEGFVYVKTDNFIYNPFEE